MASNETEPAVITVPADYLEDVRSALVAEIKQDGEMLSDNQEDAVRLSSVPPEVDRDASVEHLRRDIRALEQLLAATEDTELLTDRGTGFHALERMCRLLTDRLAAEMNYGPLDMLAVLTTVTRLEWAAKQAMAIYPQLAVAS